MLYGSAAGRVILKPLVSKGFSDISGKILDSAPSKVLIKSFAEKNGINLEDYILDDINSFNDFFRRPIRPELRPIEMDQEKLIAPCDGLLSVYRADGDLVMPIKQSAYSLSSLLRNPELAQRFYGGYVYVFRLCVNHYHRYIYPITGSKDANVKILGVYHTVRPVALRKVPVFMENAREYCLLESKGGAMIMMEVGAMLVGRIKNHHRGALDVTRGQEKGFFEYGGSTVILVTEPGSYTPSFVTSKQGEEVPVKMGQVVGTR